MRTKETHQARAAKPALVKPSEVAKYAQAAVEALNPQFKNNLKSVASMWIDQCANDTAHLWYFDGHWAISQCRVDLRDERFIQIIVSSGGFPDELLSAVEEFGRSCGCTRLLLSDSSDEVTSRHSFQVIEVVLEKRI